MSAEHYLYYYLGAFWWLIICVPGAILLLAFLFLLRIRNQAIAINKKLQQLLILTAKQTGTAIEEKKGFTGPYVKFIEPEK